jgi:enoyl-CoA hydratase
VSVDISEPEVIVRTEGRVGRLTLNRPKVLHALNLQMCLAMTEALMTWRKDPAVDLVLLDHTGERGFCAGGDIRILARSGADDGRAAREFFFHEYRLNHLLFEYPKPLMVVMDGVTMGGGVGLAMPCRYRVATERTTFAMPETGIGLFPDVGGGWHLPRFPGHMGLWLALTGARLKAADCELLGIATDYVESARLPDLKAAVVADPAAVETLLTEFEADPGRPTVTAHREEIEKAFGQPSVEKIVAALASLDSEWAAEQAASLSAKSPQTLKVAFRQLQLGAQARTFAENMAMEYAVGGRVVTRHDFLEGVRALIVDKDHNPRWDPPTLEAVSDDVVESIFAPLPSGEAWTPLI